MKRRKFVWTRAGMVAGLGVLVALGACDDDDDPVDPGNGDEPTLTSISPTEGEQGATVAVTLTGTNFDEANPGVNVSGTGITVENLDFASATSATADFVIAADATEGARDVTVETDEGESTAETFTVNAPGGGGGGDNTVEATGADQFDPSELTIQVGETVTWENTASYEHNVTPQGHTEWTAADLENSGDTFQHTFDTAGEYEYQCTIHGGMTGTITVEEEAMMP